MIVTTLFINGISYIIKNMLVGSNNLVSVPNGSMVFYFAHVDSAKNEMFYKASSGANNVTVPLGFYYIVVTTNGNFELRNGNLMLLNFVVDFTANSNQFTYFNRSVIEW